MTTTATQPGPLTVAQLSDPSLKFEMRSVTSSNLARIGYADNVLQVEFRNGSVYRYEDACGVEHTALLTVNSLAGGSIGRRFERTKRELSNWIKHEVIAEAPWEWPEELADITDRGLSMLGAGSRGAIIAAFQRKYGRDS